jgi:uncharacterized membrane protein YccC
LSHWSLLSWAAVAAFWTCLVDPGGSTRIRAKLLVGFALAGTTVAMLCAGLASLGPAPAVAILFGLTVIGGFLRVYGAEMSTLSNLLLVDAVYTVSRPIPSVGGVLVFGLLFLGGCIWASGLSLTIWRIHPFAAPRQALAGAYRTLAALAMGLAEVMPKPAGDPGWTAHAQHDRRAVREAIESARRSIAQTTGERGGMGAVGGRLSMGLDVAESEFARMIALADTLERQGIEDPDQQRRTVRLVKQLASLFHRIDRHVEDADEAAETPLRQAMRRLTRNAGAAPAPVRNLILDCAREAQHVLDQGPDLKAASPTAPAVPASSPWRQQVFGPLVAEVHPGSLILRHALRMAISVSFAYLLVRLLRVPYGYWMTMTVVIIQQPYVATTWTRALERVLGSVLGGGLAALLGMAFHSQATLLLLIFPLAMATMAFRPVNYTLFVFFLTPLFVLILDLTHPGERELNLAGVRALNTVIGGVIALAGVTLLWPASGANRMRLDLAAAIEQNGRFAGMAALGAELPPGRPDSPSIDATDMEAARRRAGLASNVAEASQQRAALESWWRRRELKGAANVLGVLRRLAGTATTLWLQPPAPVAAMGARSEAARWAVLASERLAAAVKAATPIPVSPPRPSVADSGGDILVQEIEDLYRAAAMLETSKPGTRSDRPR